MTLAVTAAVAVASMRPRAASRRFSHTIRARRRAKCPVRRGETHAVCRAGVDVTDPPPATTAQLTVTPATARPAASFMETTSAAGNVDPAIPVWFSQHHCDGSQRRRRPVAAPSATATGRQQMPRQQPGYERVPPIKIPSFGLTDQAGIPGYPVARRLIVYFSICRSTRKPLSWIWTASGGFFNMREPATTDLGECS